jgi:hypothetical protein
VHAPTPPEITPLIRTRLLSAAHLLLPSLAVRARRGGSCSKRSRLMELQRSRTCRLHAQVQMAPLLQPHLAVLELVVVAATVAAIAGVFQNLARSLHPRVTLTVWPSCGKSEPMRQWRVFRSTCRLTSWSCHLPDIKGTVGPLGMAK